MDKIKNKNISNGVKIAISSIGKSLNDNISEVFGRCPYFIIVDIKKSVIKENEIIKNVGDSQISGAGMAAAKMIAEKGVNVVIAKNVGPRALDVLEQFGIKIFDASGKANKALQDFINKK